MKMARIEPIGPKYADPAPKTVADSPKYAIPD